MKGIDVRETILGYDLTGDDGRPLAVSRLREILPRTDAPKPCFHPVYTAAGDLITEYRPGDHTWHTGFYYGWVHVNETAHRGWDPVSGQADFKKLAARIELVKPA